MSARVRAELTAAMAAVAVEISPLVKISPLPQIVLFDLDGTLADDRWRRVWGDDGCDRDPLVEVVAATWHAYAGAGYECWIATARGATYRGETRAWLERHGLRPAKLLMRDPDDARPDDVVKRAWLLDGSIPRKRVLCVLEDRPHVVAMWRAEGLACFQVDVGW